MAGQVEALDERGEEAAAILSHPALITQASSHNTNSVKVSIHCFWRNEICYTNAVHLLVEPTVMFVAQKQSINTFGEMKYNTCARMRESWRVVGRELADIAAIRQCGNTREEEDMRRIAAPLLLTASFSAAAERMWRI